MSNKLQMICTGGPYGDCTSSYKFTMPKQMTLKEFAEMIADGKEWGAIRTTNRVVLVDYNRNKEIKYRDNADPNAILKLEGTAHGGWSLMDYFVEIDREAELRKIQEQYNKIIEDNEPEPTVGLLGWVCPKCGAALSPFVNYCVKCSGNWEITFNGGVDIAHSSALRYTTECNGGNSNVN